MKVSIVIVCMNNLKNLYPCLDSIYKHTSIDYEVLVVAYKFSNENLEKLTSKYPWVKIVISNEIRGFAENNNLALKQAEGEYCFVLNDDTYFDTPVIDQLYYSMLAMPDVAIMSPNLYYPDGREQFLGRPKLNAKTFMLTSLKIWGEENMRSCYRGETGIYDIENISGAAFMIKTDVFKKLGWFDETYFFSPEDFALSTLTRKKGYRICQNSDVHITHIASGTSSAVNTATLPASVKGHLIYYSEGKQWKYIMLSAFDFLLVLLKCMVYGLAYAIKRNNKHKIYAIGEWNSLYAICSSKSPKEIFVKYYNRIVK